PCCCAGTNIDSKDSFTEKFRVDMELQNSIAPADKLKRIGIEPLGRREFQLPNGQVEEYEYAFAEMEFLDEIIGTRILFGADDSEHLLGVMALESAGFTVDRQQQTVRKLPALPLKTVISAEISL
ncbi:MAG TPA: hypothetical protein VJM50_11405, partial [Pyrinomonadaceae bacterium]|nr:hypothetical protein [Pyrinomonadaceae bacterium]